MTTLLKVSPYLFLLGMDGEEFIQKTGLIRSQLIQGLAKTGELILMYYRMAINLPYKLILPDPKNKLEAVIELFNIKSEVKMKSSWVQETMK